MDWLGYIRTDENTALKEIYIKYRQPCCSWLIKKCGLTEDAAKEIFQLSMVILYDNVITGKLTKLNSNLKTYLYSIARNQASNYFRKKKRLAETQIKSMLADYVAEESADEHTTDAELKQISLQLRIMGDPCKTLLELYYYEEMNMKDIATLMGYSNANTTKAKKYQCLKRLQTMVKSEKRVNLA